MSASLCDTFQELAALTWRRMKAAQSTGLFWSEETNTETLLLELRERHPSEVNIVAFNKLDEALNGADWEWWIGSQGRWVGMRVQAKRLSVKNRFTGLQSQRAKKQPLTQIDTLISAARRDRLTPIYCFYVFTMRSKRLGWLYAWLTFGQLAPLAGCLVGHAQGVRNSRSAALSKLIDLLQPWHFLVCPGSAHKATSRADLAFEHLEELARASGNADESSDDILLFRPRAALPEYAQAIRGFDGAETTVASVFQLANAAERHLAGLVVIDSPLGDGCRR